MSAAGKVTACLAESNGSLSPVGWLIVTGGLTAGTPGSAPGPKLSNEYGKPLPFYTVCVYLCMLSVCILYYSLSVSACLSDLHIVCFYCHLANKRVHNLPDFAVNRSHAWVSVSMQLPGIHDVTTSMSVLLIVRPKCTLAASHMLRPAESRCVYANVTDRQTDVRPMLHCAFR